MVAELIDLGFDTLELDVHITRKMIQEVQEMVRAGDVRVSSLHNYCPLPDGIPREIAGGDALMLSAPDPRERRTAVDQSRETIDWAVRLGAKAVVLHLGRPYMIADQRTALRLIECGMRERAVELIRRGLEEREAIKQPHLGSVIESVRELADHARGAGVRLGLETRYYCFEFPAFDEFETILDEVDSPTVGYWHDTGHAHTQALLGVATQQDYLRRYGDRLVGMHLHDSVGSSDHRAVTQGEIDFSQIMPYVRDDTLLVLEVHKGDARDLVRSREALWKL
jgi:sugar phosphate isomerase/epimerase